jgi:hypothetical protein
MSIQDYRQFADVRVEAINRAPRGIPEELVRLYICWGSTHHPHTQDIPLKGCRAEKCSCPEWWATARQSLWNIQSLWRSDWNAMRDRSGKRT